MMKKVYQILSLLLLVFVLVFGLYAWIAPSDAETSTKKLTFASFMDGSYGKSRRMSFDQAFPKTSVLESANMTLNGFYQYSGFSDGNDVQLIIDMSSGAANGGASLENTNPPANPEATKPVDPENSPANSETPPESSGATEGSTEPSSYVEENAVMENLGAALLIGNRAVEVPYADYNTISNYADAVTAIGDALGKDVRTFSIAVPNGAEFYTTEDYHSGDNSQINMIDYVYDHVGEDIYTVDAYSKLAAHIKEYIYFRTDHHWTQLGAYYAYTAFCEAAGFTAEPLEKFEKGEYTGFVGSMYTYLAAYPQAQILRDDPDTLTYYRPFVDTDMTYYDDASLSLAYGNLGVISGVGETSNKYLCFLGGDHPVTIIETDVENGKVCMLLKESYGNAFAPWLTSHYSKIVVIDPREFNRDGKPSLDLAAFAKEQEVDDCIILNYPMMLSSDSYVEWLNRMVK